ncbi:MAG: 3-phosphoshikimate 1-carboxyvinyltransferase [Litorimonas sp.]
MKSNFSEQSIQLKGVISAPGDKSMSHRAVIMGSMAQGCTTVDGLLEGADILSTIGAMRSFGADISRHDAETGAAQWRINGCGEGGLQQPQHDIDCGNAGTGVRLIMGAASGYALSATYIGDASLSSRPMNRILEPLQKMGVKTQSQDGGCLPATLVSDGNISAIRYVPPIASAQVKSAVILAALNVDGTTVITEKTRTRDHTENMLAAFGVNVVSKNRAEGTEISVKGPCLLKATHIIVPGDPSSAAFPIVAALITPGSDIIIENVMMNPTRTGLFECLTEMGAYLRADNFRKTGGEVIADLHVKHSKLSGITVPPERAASMIDEYPILAVAAAFAHGTTIMDGIGELRVKESDRITATITALAANGVSCDEMPHGMKVTGNGGTLVTGGATVTTHHDHRIAMSALILGLQSEAPIFVDDGSMIATSFPSFFDVMAELGAKISV